MLEYAWRIAGCCIWTPCWCHCMWPLSVAVDSGRCWRIRRGVRHGAKAQRRVGVGGEHNAWCIKLAWSPAVEVAATLAAMAMRGNAMVGEVVGGLLVCRGIIHNPVYVHLLLHRIMQPQ
jgi:hypothetical protein